jgi:D-alanyl-D-alanine carboxypeptidase
VIWGKKLFEADAMDAEYLNELLNAVSVDREHPGVEYGIGVGIHRTSPLGPCYGHGGWMPGYVSSLRYYPQHRIAIAFQINTDRGIADDSTPVVDELEMNLAQIVVHAQNNHPLSTKEF